MIDLEQFLKDLKDLQDEAIRLGLPFAMLKRIGSVADIIPNIEAARERR